MNYKDRFRSISSANNPKTEKHIDIVKYRGYTVKVYSTSQFNEWYINKIDQNPISTHKFSNFEEALLFAKTLCL
jgi:hypothetical protein